MKMIKRALMTALGFAIGFIAWVVTGEQWDVEVFV